MTRPSAQDRLGRLLAIVPWVAARDGPAIADICRRFGVSEAELLADLDLLFLCGVYPFTPDVLIEVDIADGRVWIRFADFFSRPLRLNAPEGLALIGAGAAMLRVPGADQDGPLARALDKLAAVLGVAGDDALDVELAPVGTDILDKVRQATDASRLVEIDYYSFGRDHRETRVVEPWRVFNTRGQWYLSGYCQRAGGERLFRVDRISRAEILDRTFEPPPPAGSPEVFHAGADDALVVLDLEPEAWWVAEKYPNEGVVEQPGGRLRVSLRVSERPWLERLLLRAGKAATVVSGDESVLPEAAIRVLTRYRSDGSRASGQVSCNVP